jgi:hypothetical protein
VVMNHYIGKYWKLMSKKMKERVAVAACRLVCYDAQNVYGVHKWFKKVKITKGERVTRINSS